MLRELPLEISLAAGADQQRSANLFTASSDMFPRSAIASVVGLGSMAGSAGNVLLAFIAGHTLQLTHCYTRDFGIAASSRLLTLGLLVLLALGLTQLETAA